MAEIVFRKSFDVMDPYGLSGFSGDDSDPINKNYTDALGYRSVQQQVESFLVAGERLDAFRAGYYDDDFVSDGSDLVDIDLPVGREPYGDFSDTQARVNQFSDYWRDKVYAAQKEQNARVASDAAELAKLRESSRVRISTTPRVSAQGVADGSPSAEPVPT